MSIRQAISGFLRGFLNLALTDGREDDLQDDCSSCEEEENSDVSSKRSLHKVDISEKALTFNGDMSASKTGLKGAPTHFKRVSFAKERSSPAFAARKTNGILKQGAMNRTYDKENQRPNFKYTKLIIDSNFKGTSLSFINTS